MMTVWAVLGGFVLDALFGDPAWLPHPVVYMGKAISKLEKFLRPRLPKTPQGELLGGAIVAFCLSLIHISEPTRRTPISYAVFCLKKNTSLKNTSRKART